MIEIAAQVVVNDPTAAAANAAAIVNAFSQAARVWLPDGQIVYTQQISLPSSAKKLFGAATLVAAGPTFGGGLVNFNGTSGLVLEDFSVSVDGSAYPNTAGIDSLGAVGTEIRRVTCRAPLGIDVAGLTDILVDHCTVPSFVVQAFAFENCTNVRVRDCEASGQIRGPNNNNTYAFFQSREVYVSRCHADHALAFGFSFSGVHFFGLEGCVSISSGVEAFQFVNSRWGSVVGNKAAWIDASGTDFGMSFNASPGNLCANITVSGNVIDSPTKQCAALDGSEGGVQRVTLVGNTFNSPCMGGGQSFAPANPAVVLYGSGCQSCEVSENGIHDLGGHMKTKVAEFNVGGIPNFNRLGPNGVPLSGIDDCIKLGAQSKAYLS